jgi:hypothetical protein
VIVEYKQYHWNWWRTTLIANSIFFPSVIIISAFYPQTFESSPGFDIIGMLQLFILFVSLYVFGKGQFQKAHS